MPARRTPYQSLTYLGQPGRARQLARDALSQFDLGTARLTLIQRGENTICCGDIAANVAGTGELLRGRIT
jgi:hypothetical protein